MPPPLIAVLLTISLWQQQTPYVVPPAAGSQPPQSTTKPANSKPYVVPPQPSAKPPTSTQQTNSSQYVIPPAHATSPTRTPAIAPKRPTPAPPRQPAPLVHRPAQSPPAAKQATRESQPPEAKSLKDEHKPAAPASAANPVFWTDPGSIPSRNLFYGQGGADRQPRPPFKFLKEDKDDTANPAFYVEDATGKQWRVDLGAAARAAVAASRLMWAVGFFAPDDYFLDHGSVSGAPLSHSRKLIARNGEFQNARFSRLPQPEKKIATWSWKITPQAAAGQQFNALRVLVAVLNGWDLNDENNAIYQDETTGRQIYLVSEIHATFGTNGLSLKRPGASTTLDGTVGPRFITKVSGGLVDFSTPAPPVGNLLPASGPKQPDSRSSAHSAHDAKSESYEMIGRNIPLEDVRRAASLLAKLSHRQLTEAFRAAGYSPDDLDEYVAVIESRIDELKSL